jgi:hypothetical protein
VGVVELAWCAPVAIPLLVMIAALALHELEHALLGQDNQIAARTPQPIPPDSPAPSEQSRSPSPPSPPACATPSPATGLSPS